MNKHTNPLSTSSNCFSEVNRRTQKHQKLSSILLAALLAFPIGASAQKTVDDKKPVASLPQLFLEVEFAGHADKVKFATFSADGKRIATASDDGTSRLWDIEGKLLAILAGETDTIQFSPDGSRIMTRSSDGIRLWNSTGKSVAMMAVHADGAIFSPDGKRIVTRSKNGSARLWDNDGRELAVLSGHTDWVVNVSYSPDGSRIVTTSDDRTARLWDSQGKLLAVLTGHTDGVFFATFSPDSNRITTDSFDNTVRLWDREGKEIAVLPGNSRWARESRYSPDSSRFVIATNDKTARVYDSEGKEVAVLAGHTGEVREARFSPDGSHILTASDDTTARLWDRHGKPIAVLKGHANVPLVAFSPDGHSIITREGSNARLWDKQGNPLASLKGQNGSVGTKFSPDGNNILTRSGGNTARLYRVPQDISPIPDIPTKSNIVALLKQLQSDLIVVEGDPIEKTTLDELMRKHHVPGVSIAVIRNGKIDWAHGFGFADVESKRKVTTQTLFQAASISKPVAAVAALSMVQDGLLDLDEDVNLKFKSWKVPTNKFTDQHPVTLRQLLSHTGGTNVLGLPGYARNAKLPTTIDVLEGRGNTDPVRVDGPPGINWRYSDGGYIIIGQLMEDVAGKPFPEIVRERVFEPVGMTHSTYLQPLPRAKEVDAATAYATNGSKIKGRYRNYPEIGAAGLWTTAEDLARFVLAIQQSRAGKTDSLLSRRLAKEMLTPVKSRYGLGAYLSEDGKRFGHGGTNRGFRIRGSNRGFRTRLSASINDGWGIVILTNGDGGSALCELVPIAAAKAYGWSKELLLDAYGTYGSIRRKRADIGEAALARLAGTYECLPEWSHAVSRQALFPNMDPVKLMAIDGRLIAEVPKGGGTERFEFLPQSEFQAAQRRNGLLMDFIVKDGRVTGFKFREVEAKRIDE